MNIFFNGKNQGEWSEQDLPRLAKHLGTSVEALVQESAQAQAAANLSAKSKELMSERIGSQQKMITVTADAALVCLLGLGAIYKAQGDDARAAINPVLESLLGEGAGAQLEKLVDDVASKKLVTPLQVKPLQSVLDDVRACAGGAVSVMQDIAAQMAAMQGDAPAEQ